MDEDDLLDVHLPKILEWNSLLVSSSYELNYGRPYLHISEPLQFLHNFRSWCHLASSYWSGGGGGGGSGR